MYQLLGLLAQNSTQFQRGLAGFQWGMTVAGIGILMIGAGLIFSKSKDSEKATSPAVKWLGFAIAASAGCGLIAYAWLAF